LSVVNCKVRIQIERMVQRERAADKKPWHHGAGDFRERRQGQGRKQIRILAKTAFEGDGEPTRNQFGMAACDRDEAIGRHAPCDGSEVGAGAGLRRPPFAPRGQRIDLVHCEKIVEANQTVGRIAPVAADMPDWKDLRGNPYGELIVIACGDAAAHDQGHGADPVECCDDVGTPPPHGKRHRNEAGAQHAENGEHVFHRTGHLDGDDCVRVQSHAAQASRDCRHHAVGLAVGEGARLSVRDALAIGSIEQRHRVRTPPRRPFEQIVEGRAAPNAWRAGPPARIDENHLMVLTAAVCSTRFPEDSRTAMSLPVALSWSSGRPIDREGETRGLCTCRRAARDRVRAPPPQSLLAIAP